MEITKEMLAHYIDFAQGDSAVYHVCDDGSLETLYLSENIPSLLDMTREEYLKITERDAMDLTLPSDREGLKKATVNCIQKGKPFDYYYRVFHKAKGFEWVHVHAHVCGIMDGDPILLALFSNMTTEGGIYQQILNSSDRKVLVIDRENHDILYANEITTIDDFGNARNLLDQKCYAFLHNFNAPCEHCFLKVRQNEEFCDETRYDSKTEKWEQFTKRVITWCGHPALLVYIKDVTKAKVSELSVERYRQMYADATQDAKLIVWTYDAENHRATLLWDGYTKEICEKLHVPQIIDNVPDSLAVYVEPGDRDAFIKMYREVESGAERSSFEFRFQLPGQSSQQVERITFRRITDKNGNLLTVHCCGQNITILKQAQIDYERLKKELSGNISGVVGSFQINLSRNLYIGGYSPYLKVLEALKKDTADEHFAAAAFMVINDEIRENILRNYTCTHLIELFKSGQVQLDRDYPVRTSSEGIMWIHSTLHMMLNPGTGDIEGITYCKDITRQKRNEEIIKLTLNKGCDYVGIIDPVTNTYERHSGPLNINGILDGEKLPYTEVRSRTAIKYLSLEESQKLVKQTDIPVLLKALEADNRYVVSYSYRLDESKPLLFKQIRFSWLNEYKREIFVIQQDITEAQNREREYADQLRKAMLEAEHANTMKTEFLSNVSHDMRTPLNAVLGYANLAAQAKTSKEAIDYITKISEAGNLLLTLINDTLDLTKIESGEILLKPAPISCGEAIGRILAAIRPEMEKKQIRFVLDNSRAVMATINIDSLRVQEIFINLLSNAVKFTPKGGEIALIVECVKLEPDCIHDRITVRDNGCGISREFLPKLFEPFAQERLGKNMDAGGTGLGLSIVKRLVDLMGGTIEVHSELGKGSEFIVYLDFERMGEKEIGTEVKRGHPSSLEGYCVLLCEDNAMNREIAQKLLEFRGVKVECAENGKIGLDQFSASSFQHFDAILMDRRMPVMDGFETVKVIRALNRPDAKTIPIIAMTADAFDDDVRYARSIGIDGYVTKPIEPELLYQALREVLIAGKTDKEDTLL